MRVTAKQSLFHLITHTVFNSHIINGNLYPAPATVVACKITALSKEAAVFNTVEHDYEICIPVSEGACKHILSVLVCEELHYEAERHLNSCIRILEASVVNAVLIRGNVYRAKIINSCGGL